MKEKKAEHFLEGKMQQVPGERGKLKRTMINYIRRFLF